MIDMNPGVYPDVPMADYLAWERYSRSWLAGLIAGDSPRAVRHAQTTHRASTDAQAFGSAFHLLVFEPMNSLEGIVVAPKRARRSKVDKEAWEAFEQENADKIIVKAEDWETMRRMADALAADPVAAQYLDGVQDREVSVTWEEPFLWAPGELGDRMRSLPMKARIDGLDPEAGVIVDLKTTGTRARGTP